MPAAFNRSAPLPSAPFRFATLTSTARWGGGGRENRQQPTTKEKYQIYFRT